MFTCPIHPTPSRPADKPPAHRWRSRTARRTRPPPDAAAPPPRLRHAQIGSSNGYTPRPFNERGDQQRLCPSPRQASGGTETASSARYLRTVRQSQPTSANVAPAACKARKRRMFIQDSVSDHEQSPFELVYLAVNEPEGDPHSQDCIGRAQAPALTAGVHDQLQLRPTSRHSTAAQQSASHIVGRIR
jgi:hypothetical protein